MMKHYNHVKHEMQQMSPKEPSVSEIAEVVASDIQAVWIKASIPIVSHNRILKLIRCSHDEFRKLMKPYKGRKTDKKYMMKLQAYADKSKQKLFDIAICKCTHGMCKCAKEHKVPADEQNFLRDQRTTRLMFIGSVDKVISAKMKRRLERKLEESARVKRKLDLCDQRCSVSNLGNNGLTDIDDLVAADDELNETDQENNVIYDAPSVTSLESTTTTSNKQMRKKLPKLAKICDRFGVSDRAGAAIATAVLEDFGFVSQRESTHVIDRYKLRRERKFSRDNLTVTNGPIQTLYFDGRKDKTLKLEKNGRRWYRKIVSEEHITLICEPGEKFLTHVVPDSSSGKSITDSICSYYVENSLDISQVLGVGCDGTATNTGIAGGIIRRLEMKLGKPLQWLPCQLHANELPLRHLMKHLDGGTSGPKEFSGPIGSSLPNCELLNVCQFEAINSELPEVEVQTLSTDQRYLYEMCQSVKRGFCSEDLARRNPGKMAHSRWLTTANRILRLYISTKNPTPSLQQLATFIVQVYAPVWFAIKTTPSCKDGARHVWLTVHLSRAMPDKVRAVIDPVIQRNAYFAHPENLLLAMAFDERDQVRQLGLRRILKARQQKITDIRKFVIPPINFDATDYIELINWMDIDLTAPPLLSQIPTSEISGRIFEVDYALLPLINVPCHTQAVERHVKLVTEASQSVCGDRARNGFIRNRIASREQMSTFNNKKDYRFD